MSSEPQRFRCALSASSAFPMLLWFALDDQTMFMTIVSALLPIGLKYHRVFTAFDTAHARHPVLQPWIHSLRCGGGGGWDATASKAEGKIHLQVWPTETTFAHLGPRENILTPALQDSYLSAPYVPSRTSSRRTRQAVYRHRFMIASCITGTGIISLFILFKGWW